MPAGYAVSFKCYQFHFWKVNSTSVLRKKTRKKIQKLNFNLILIQKFKNCSRLERSFSKSSHSEQKPFVLPVWVVLFCVKRGDPACSRGTSTPRGELLPVLLFPFPSPEPCHPGSSTEAVKEDGKPSYCRMITIINIHGWFTYHSWLHRHGSRYETSTGVARWYILHCATMDLCIL